MWEDFPFPPNYFTKTGRTTSISPSQVHQIQRFIPGQYPAEVLQKKGDFSPFFFGGTAAGMLSEDHIRAVPQRAVHRQRLLGVYVQNSPTYPPLPQGLQQGRLVYRASPSDICNDCVGVHDLQQIGRNETFGLHRTRKRIDQDIRFGQGLQKFLLSPESCLGMSAAIQTQLAAETHEYFADGQGNGA